MAPDPKPLASEVPRSETTLRRLLGGMSVFTLVMTLPQVLYVGMAVSARNATQAASVAFRGVPLDSIRTGRAWPGLSNTSFILSGYGVESRAPVVA